MGESELAGFALLHHVAYLDAMVSEVPHDYATQEVNHLTLVHFAVAGLSLLRELDRKQAEEEVYDRREESGGEEEDFGKTKHKGTEGLIEIENPNLVKPKNIKAKDVNVVSYDVANIDSKALLSSMKKLQQPDGSFMPTHIGAERDLRFVYCAAAVCSMLKDWTGMDKEKTKEYILNCQSYDGGFGMVPGSESHGGGTFCAVAALCLMGFIQVDLASNLQESAPIDVRLLLEWCLQRQAADGGFQGRRNKPTDTCYAFWVGGVLKIIGAYHLIDHSALRNFLLTCQSPYGGFQKFPYDRFPDIYHSYYGLAALSLLEEQGLEPLCIELGILSAAL